MTPLSLRHQKAYQKYFSRHGQTCKMLLQHDGIDTIISQTAIVGSEYEIWGDDSFTRSVEIRISFTEFVSKVDTIMNPIEFIKSHAKAVVIRDYTYVVDTISHNTFDDVITITCKRGG